MYRVAMSLNRYEWLLSTISFHDQSKLRTKFVDERIVRMRWFLTQFENSAQNYYRHVEFFVTDEKLQNSQASYNHDFKVYLKDKPEKY